MVYKECYYLFLMKDLFFNKWRSNFLEYLEIFLNGLFFVFFLYLLLGFSYVEGRRKKYEVILSEILNYIILEGILGNCVLFLITKS